MKSNWKRISALVLSLALLLCAAVPAMAEAAAKDETVYILSDAQGQARRIIVSDWLKNPDKLDELTDATRLSGMTVVEGNATFERDGERFTWDADGKDVYYQGDSDEELPLTLQITYLVDGEEVTAADMAGKSGHVTIRFAYTPAADQKA
ncbi:MAG: X-X-X-Leu-X-X-Gly heptad, partial [Eubacteriales bacterium]|nr:X-X-X-Leu-X-X-Gly heptad [Eubacteriales bacterium]